VSCWKYKVHKRQERIPFRSLTLQHMANLCNTENIYLTKRVFLPLRLISF